jgi:hypothetical protein
VMGRFYPQDAIFEFAPYRLPRLLALGSDLLLLGGTVWGGWMDRGAGAERRPRLGVGVALVAATVFAPIAWTHYSIVLVVPVMLVAEEMRWMRGVARAGAGVLIAIAAALNYMPLAPDVWSFSLGRWAVLRGQFFAGLLCISALGLAWWMRRSFASERDVLPRNQEAGTAELAVRAK